MATFTRTFPTRLWHHEHLISGICTAAETEACTGIIRPALGSETQARPGTLRLKPRDPSWNNTHPAAAWAINGSTTSVLSGAAFRTPPAGSAMLAAGATGRPRNLKKDTGMNKNAPNRWLIAVAGIVMQIALGAVYAWSVFRIPLTSKYGWTVSQVTLAFELAILILGFAAFAGGLWMKRVGPRWVAAVAGLCYGLGVVLAGQAGGHLGLLYLSYGVLGGTGLGLAYIVPVATLIKWFPDKRGMITGLEVAGFGAGALITAPVAQLLMSRVGISQTFTILGCVYFVAVSGSALLMRNPPDDYRPAGWQPSLSRQEQSLVKDYTLGEALRTWQWYGLWAILFLNTLAGISIISQAAPMAQEVTHVSAGVAAGLVGIISIANGAGRFLWAWFSDYIGRRRVFQVMFLAQMLIFLLLSRVHSFGGLASLAFIVLLCYGGGFGTMPAFAADFFGARSVGSIYGLMLTAWGFAGLLGPTLIAYVRQTTGYYIEALNTIALVMLFSTILPFVIRPPSDRSAKATPSRSSDIPLDQQEHGLNPTK
jgi:OFA family oxalate/formate antiporter-like MFS transporter